MSDVAATRSHVIELPVTAAAAGLARRELALIPGISGEVGYKVLLLATELIALCIGDVEPDPRARLRLSVSTAEDRVRVEVGGRRSAVSPGALLNSSETPSLGGYGLRIVDKMAAAWGVHDEGDRAIWFELERR